MESKMKRQAPSGGKSKESSSNSLGQGSKVIYAPKSDLMAGSSSKRGNAKSKAAR